MRIFAFTFNNNFKIVVILLGFDKMMPSVVDPNDLSERVRDTHNVRPVG